MNEALEPEGHAMVQRMGVLAEGTGRVTLDMNTRLV
jgi:hypothetical protein